MRADLAIPRLTLRALTHVTREPASAALRRLFALNLSAPWVQSTLATTAQPVEEARGSTIASSDEREEEIRAYDPAVADSGWVFQWIWEKLARPNASPNGARAMPFPPAPTRPPDSLREALDREMTRFNCLDREEEVMQFASDPHADPDRWWLVKEAILIVFFLVVPVALLMWLLIKGRGPESSPPAPLPEFAVWTPIAA